MNTPNAPDWLTSRPIAHRGLHDRDAGVMENSLAAARAAIAGGFAIECDVQDSRDGEAFVFHDHTLERLTGGEGAFKARKAQEIAGLSLRGAALAENPPRLSDFLALLAGRVPLVLEIKSRFDGDETLTRRTCEIVAGYDGPLCLKSFDPFVVALARDLAPERPRGIVAQAEFSGAPQLDDAERRAMANLLHFPQTLPDFISWNHRDLPHAAPFLCRTLRAMPVMAWTVRDGLTAQAIKPWADQIVFEEFDPRFGCLARSAYTG